MSATKSYIVLNNKKMFKAGVAGVICAAADNALLKNSNVKSNLMFGGSAAAGILGISVVIEEIMTMLPTYQPLGAATKGVEQRVVEAVAGAGSAYAVNYFIKVDNTTSKMLPKLGIICVADVLAETLADMWMSETIDPFSPM